ncbi:MAG: SpoIID/LytB domain-containing protein [Clostridia bacterium]|nr:SpoIID/LytB domain-containing protein [Clostridia bacterium]
MKLKIISHKKIFLSLLIFLFLALGGTYLYFHPSHSQAKRIANDFLHEIIENGDYGPFLSPQLKEHPLADLLQAQEITQFRVEQVESMGKDQLKVWGSASFPIGDIPIKLDMTRYNNHWLITGLSEVTFYSHGIPVAESKVESNRSIYTMNLDGEIREFHSLSTAGLKTGQPIRFYVVDDLIAVVKPLHPVPLTRVLSLSNTMLEDEQLGIFPVQERFSVFLQKEESYEFQGYYALPIGVSDVVLYRSEEQEGIMAVITKPFQNYNQIRVLLNTDAYTGFLHSKIEITCQDGFDVISTPNNIQLSFESRQIAEFCSNGQEGEVYLNGQKLSSSRFRWHIRSKGEAPLYVKSIHRNQADSSEGTPYQGSLETAVEGEYLTLVNELDLEEYLMTVVPSEMPVSFGLEALKVQAVAARSYAARAMQTTGFRPYGAHLDDSTASQVYNNISKQDVANYAVNETTGIVTVYGDEIVDTRFFSTSSGYTANFHEVWSNRENEFPGDEIPYLTANPQYPGKIPDLYREENFRAFLNQANLEGYDQFSPFFRWKIKMTREQLEAVLSQSLPALYKQQAQFILTKTVDGSYESREIPEETGTLLNIEVLQRGEGGNMMELEITTTHGIYKIRKEYNIRQALKPVNYSSGKAIELSLKDGSIRENFPLLPSAFAYIDFHRDTDGNIVELSIHGGGYGHGVGMSQYGTYGLTLLGKNWQSILKHYYPGSELRSLYD